MWVVHDDEECFDSRRLVDPVVLVSIVVQCCRAFCAVCLPFTLCRKRNKSLFTCCIVLWLLMAFSFRPSVHGLVWFGAGENKSELDTVGGCAACLQPNVRHDANISKLALLEVEPTTLDVFCVS